MSATPISDHSDLAQPAPDAHQSDARRQHLEPGEDPGDQRNERNDPGRHGSPCDRHRLADVEERRVSGRSLTEIDRVEPLDRLDDVLAGGLERARRQPVHRVACRVIRVAVADGREVQPGDVVTLEDGEVRVVRQAVVDLNRERCTSRMRRRAGPGPDDPAVARPGLEQHRVTAGSDGFDVHVRLKPIHDFTIRGQPGGSHQAVLLAIGDEDHQRVTSIGSRAKHPRGLQRHRHPQSIVGRARRVGSGIGRATSDRSRRDRFPNGCR